MPVKLLTSGGGGVNLVPSSSIASDQTMYLPTSGTSGGTVLCTDSSGGTANGVLYLNGSKQVTSGSGLVFDSSGNLGIGSGVIYASPLKVVTSSSATSQGTVRFGSSSNEYSISSGADYLGMLFTTNGSERMRLDSSGNLLVKGANISLDASYAGTGTSDHANVWVYADNAAGKNAYLNLVCPGSNSGTLMYERSTSRLYAYSQGGGVYLGATATSWTSTSDERVKDIIEPITNASKKVSSLRAVIGKYKTDEEGIRRSFLIAQDVQAVLPEAVSAENPEELGLSYTDVIPLLVAAIKEQQAIIEAQTQRIEALEYTKQGE